jgi:2-amino-4-hydroxy-6-hydroxymethyldihydropteridine diphosphokinase
MKAGIALGSNIEPRLHNLQAARRRLLELAAPNSPVLVSKVYESSPMDCQEGSEPFLNAAMEMTTNLSPVQLLEKLKGIETDLGRPAIRAKNTPRPIDLDILYCDNLTLSDEVLTIPHPRMTERLFVIQPLTDIRPDLRLPNFTKNIEELLAELQGGQIVTLFSNTIY